MGMFNSFAFGSGSTSIASTTVMDIAKPMLRIAGITKLANITPSEDQLSEIYPLLNRMLQSWNCDGHKIYTTSIAEYALVANQKIYTIGPGGDFNTARPLFIMWANTIFPTTPQVRYPIDILSDSEWASIAVQDITGAPPFQLYYDGGLNSTTGRASIYLRFQPPAGYKLELYTWEALASSFTASSDAVVFPPGYEEALVYNGALRLAELYPLEAMVAPGVEARARLALRSLMTLNMQNPRIGCDPALQANTGQNGSALVGRGWLDGNIR